MRLPITLSHLELHELRLLTARLQLLLALHCPRSLPLTQSDLTRSQRLDLGHTARRLLPFIILIHPLVVDTRWNGEFHPHIYMMCVLNICVGHSPAALLKAYAMLTSTLLEVLPSHAPKKRRTSFSAVSAVVCFAYGRSSRVLTRNLPANVRTLKVRN
jgi:hypothetical protein